MFRKELIEKMDDLKECIIMPSKPDIKSCRNYDMAVVQTDYLGHSDYHAYKNACKKYGVKLIHSNNNNTERFMDLIRTETEKKE